MLRAADGGRTILQAMPAFPILTTRRLTLREMRLSDADGYTALLTDSAEGYFITDVPLAATGVPAKIESNQRAYLAGTSLYWSLEFQQRFVGFVALHLREPKSPALSYAISKSWRRRGFAREAIVAVAHYSFEALDAERVVAHTHLENVASAALVRSLGFKEVAPVRSPHGPRRRFVCAPHALQKHTGS